MRTAVSLVGALALALASPTVAEAATTSRSSSRSFGNDRFGASVRRTATLTHAGASGAIAASTTVSARIAGSSHRVMTLARRVTGRVGGGQETRRFQLELIGRGRVTVGLAVTRSISIRTFTVPVPVGPFPLSVRGSVGLTVGTRGSVTRRSDALSVGLEGSASVGGTVDLGVGVPGARAGVEGALSLVKAGLPATATLRRTGLTVDVALVLSSRVDVRLFARVGVGPLARTWKVDAPFLSFVFAERRQPVAQLTVRG